MPVVLMAVYVNIITKYFYIILTGYVWENTTSSATYTINGGTGLCVSFETPTFSFEANRCTDFKGRNRISIFISDKECVVEIKPSGVAHG